MLDYTQNKNLYKDKSKLVSTDLRAPFKWAGSKNRMFKRYMASGFFTSEDPKYFVDLFAGTGIVSQWVMKNYPNIKIIINESCEELMNMYLTMQNFYPDFEKEYKKHVASYASYSTPDDRKKHYYGLRDKYALNYKGMTPAEEGATLFYLLQTGFNGIWQTSKNFNWRYATAAGVMTWKPYGDLFDLPKIKRYADFIGRCHLKTGDFEKQKSYIGKDTWFYADPPYRVSRAKYQSSGNFGPDDHQRLIDFMNLANSNSSLCAMSNREDVCFGLGEEPKTITKGFFADKFDNDWNVNYFDVKYTAGRHNKGAKGKEVLIKNY